MLVTLQLMKMVSSVTAQLTNSLWDRDSWEIPNLQAYSIEIM